MKSNHIKFATQKSKTVFLNNKSKNSGCIGLGISFLIFISVSCKKFVETDTPITQIVSTEIFKNDATAIAAIAGVYSQMINHGFASGDFVSVTQLAGLGADELISYNSSTMEFYKNSINPNSSVLTGELWGQAYQYIYTANAILEGLSKPTEVTEPVKKQLEGEAKFIRALCHFYLVNLWGDVPLVISTDYRINSVASRSAKSQVYQQIVNDLKDAQTLLLDNYSFSNSERVRPNKWAATALLARVYLYMGDWVNAESQATSIINNTSTYNLENNLNNVFLKNSSEAIWQLRPVNPSNNTNEGYFFILLSTPTEVSASNQLVNAFEISDNRRTNWIGSSIVGGTTYYYPFKYKIRVGGSPLNEYSMVLRLAEQYLIRAEARIQQNNILGTQTDINVIRSRAGLPNTTAITKTLLLAAIEQERNVELFTEWGHRWLDIKRWPSLIAPGDPTKSRADDILSAIKPNWQSYKKFYPIPQTDLNRNPNLTQNSGY